ncbi:Acetyltransferase (GNAT) family protein [Austwickia chelonae]|uniref:Putative acetyltransferase n=1 Tax=Austwickia chelonae NBRC 105200 TaxID=1184607 RepID=K6UMN9_9MICO|nr:GNAT family N-acetyltransferase [Austwickia chelonae]GAB78276.1 putative acetyltransferase [Austwickia chelonae NBRC 105200]SEW00255.1 Acetyltransferase (GNAT) family protein [Austwickia chelonae]
MSDVRAAGVSEYPAVAALLGQAFCDDPSLGPVVRGSGDPAARLARMFAQQIEEVFAREGAVDVLTDAGGRLVGASLWAEPGAWGSSWWAGLRALPASALALGRCLPAALRSERACASRHPTFPHWYLYVVGAAVDARGHGVGTALLRHGLSRADAEGAPAYLEATTPRSALLYERWGFVEMGPVPNPLGDQEAVGMWRPPRRGVQGAPGVEESLRSR